MLKAKSSARSTVALDISKRKREEAEWLRPYHETDEAHSPLKTLSGCSHLCSCKKKSAMTKAIGSKVETYIRDPLTPTLPRHLP